MDYESFSYHYEADCDGDGIYECTNITGDFKHKFEKPGTYRIALRGHIPGLYITDGVHKSGFTHVEFTHKLLQDRILANPAVKGTERYEERIRINYDALLPFPLEYPELPKSENAGKSISDCELEETRKSYLTQEYLANRAANYIEHEQKLRNRLNMAELEELKIDRRRCSYYIRSIEQWGDIEWKTMYGMFENCRYMHIFANDAPNLKCATSLEEMFSGAESINESIEHWDVSHISNFQGMFSYALRFNQPLNRWNVSRAIDMRSMFRNAYSFNQPLDSWDVSHVHVEDMDYMFTETKFFNQPLNAWQVRNTKICTNMFNGAESFNMPLDKWDMSLCDDLTGMFANAISFNQPIESWDVSNVTDMTGMFSNARAFNQTLDKWDVSHVTCMALMFRGAESFNQPLNHWDTSHVMSMFDMFVGTDTFEHSLENWDTSCVEDPVNHA
ncbi:MAG: DUF285 domain-containing protein [Proteobacteria bacterium]|nr:DUF285 domain-containing protein [Pseudomonadota bacterium]